MTNLDSYNPSTGKLIASIESTSLENIPVMIQNAHKAQKIWAKVDPSERIEILSEIFENMKTQKEYIALTLSEEM